MQLPSQRPRVMPHRWLTTAQVTSLLQITPATLYRLVRAGTMPAVRVGGQWRFRRADLEAWLTRGRVG
jgi:excisionase family DNA binding protein